MKSMGRMWGMDMWRELSCVTERRQAAEWGHKYSIIIGKTQEQEQSNAKLPLLNIKFDCTKQMMWVSLQMLLECVLVQKLWRAVYGTIEHDTDLKSRMVCVSSSWEITELVFICDYFYQDYLPKNELELYTENVVKNISVYRFLRESGSEMQRNFLYEKNQLWIEFNSNLEITNWNRLLRYLGICVPTRCTNNCSALLKHPRDNLIGGG